MLKYFLACFLLTGCAPPSNLVSEYLKHGVNCKAEISLPDTIRAGEIIDVDVKIYNCTNIEGALRNGS